MTHPRPPDWPAMLERHLQEWARRPFSWGRCDCVHFVCAWLAVLRPGEGFETMPEAWHYADEHTGMRAIRDAGGLEVIATRALGPAIPPALAHRGDVVSVKSGRRVALSICAGARLAALGPEGLALLPADLGRAAWEV
jgi:hypothetical protein